MRDIKFRAWDNHAKKLIDNVLIDTDGTLYKGWRDLEDGLVLDGLLMQYTGLKDKNGKEIYEGDIVLFTYWWFDGNEAESELKGSVVYTPEYASFGLEGVKNAEWLKHIGDTPGSSDTAPFASWTFNQEDIEVIGNIHESPELLKEESDE